MEVLFYKKPYRHYLVNGIEVPSVTSALGIISSDALIGWAANATIRGIIDLYTRRGEIRPDFDWIYKGLREEKLGPHYAKKEGGLRGTAIHQAYQAWSERGEAPIAARLPRSWQGYMHGLAKFLVREAPEVIQTEHIVGSAKYLYAGTLDTVARMRFRAGHVVLGDVKTSKGVYDKHHLQIEGYEGAQTEMGENPTDERIIIHLDRNGSYRLVPSVARYEQFLDVLRAYKSVSVVREAMGKKPMQP